jgi:hypothetical protein
MWDVELTIGDRRFDDDVEVDVPPVIVVIDLILSSLKTDRMMMCLFPK